MSASAEYRKHLDEQLPRQRVEWMVARIGRAGMGLFIAAGLLGLLSPSPEAVVRGLAIYFFLLVIFRFAGKRALTQTTNFDLVLLLIISETTQQAMIGDDRSLMNAFLLITTLVFADIVLGTLKRRFPAMDRALEGTPVRLMEDGKLIEEHLREERIDEEELLFEARRQHGLTALNEVHDAILESSGDVSIVPNAPRKRKPADDEEAG